MFKKECAKLRGLCTIIDFVPSCHLAVVSPKYFVVGISWAEKVVSWVFRFSKIFSRRYFLGCKDCLVGISWFQNFS